MAKPVDHGIVSATNTIGSSTVTGTIAGVLGMGLLGAAIIGLPALAIGGAVFGFTGGVFTIAGIAATVGGLVGVTSGAVPGAIAGGILGLLSGTSRVSSENLAFNEIKQQNALGGQVQQVQQQAYMQGAHDGQVHLVQQIQEAQQAQTGFHAQRELQRRAQQNAQTGPAVG
jgi:hypothetical protein